MREVASKLYVGTIDEAHLIFSKKDEWRLVNVAKTLHYEINGWSTKGRYTDQLYYVLREEPTFITVNWVDTPRAELFNYQNKGVSGASAKFRPLLAAVQCRASCVVDVADVDPTHTDVCVHSSRPLLV